MIKRQIGWDTATITIPVEIVSRKIQNNGILKLVFIAMLGLVDLDYVCPDEIRFLFEEALAEQIQIDSGGTE